MDVVFSVSPCAETGGFTARWDDPAGGGITTQGESLADLQAMINDAVLGYFDAESAPIQVNAETLKTEMLKNVI